MKKNVVANIIALSGVALLIACASSKEEDPESAPGVVRQSVSSSTLQSCCMGVAPAPVVKCDEGCSSINCGDCPTCFLKDGITC